jgi:hypothetical protein
MNRIEYLQDQAARAERLANSSLDKLTLERLAAFAEECRAQMKVLSEGEPLHSRRYTEAHVGHSAESGHFSPSSQSCSSASASHAASMRLKR